MVELLNSLRIEVERIYYKSTNLCNYQLRKFFGLRKHSMGCDIHLYLEYQHPRLGVQPVIANSFEVQRDYALFSALAGVNSYDTASVRFPPRGLPETVSAEIFAQYYEKIIAQDAEDWHKNTGQAWCYPEDAESYKRHGAEIKQIDNMQYVSCPDWHSTSYLYRREVFEAFEYSGYNSSAAPVEFSMVLQFMAVINTLFEDDSSRIVFWFDN